MAEGWISLHRKLMESSVWNEEPKCRAAAWVDLLLLAAHKDTSFMKRGIRITVKRGQVAHSMKALGDRWGWSRGKVRRFLQDLEGGHQIGHQITKLTTLITIVNYDLYQSERTIKRTSDGHQTDIYNNVNNDKQGNTHTTGAKIRELSTGLKTCIDDNFFPSQATIDYCAARQLPDPTDQVALDDFINTNLSKNWQSANWDAEYRKFLPKWRLRNDKETDKPRRNRAERYFDALSSVPESD